MLINFTPRLHNNKEICYNYCHLTHSHFIVGTEVNYNRDVNTTGRNKPLDIRKNGPTDQILQSAVSAFRLGYRIVEEERGFITLKFIAMNML